MATSARHRLQRQHPWQARIGTCVGPRRYVPQVIGVSHRPAATLSGAREHNASHAPVRSRCSPAGRPTPLVVDQHASRTWSVSCRTDRWAIHRQRGSWSLVGTRSEAELPQRDPGHLQTRKPGRRLWSELGRNVGRRRYREMGRLVLRGQPGRHFFRLRKHLAQYPQWPAAPTRRSFGRHAQCIPSRSDQKRSDDSISRAIRRHGGGKTRRQNPGERARLLCLATAEWRNHPSTLFPERLSLHRLPLRRFSGNDTLQPPGRSSGRARIYLPSRRRSL